MAKHAIISFNQPAINASVPLTGSKSECNRALILQAVSKGKVSVENLSDAADTQVLLQTLSAFGSPDASPPLNSKTIDIGPAGTAMRFLTAFLATQTGKYLLTGSERMQQRPIGLLVNALTALGADIQYVNREGFPPLEINGGFTQTTASLSIQSDVSSQYISALLLIAPALPLGLKLELEGELTSMPYVEMTLSMLETAGIATQWEGSRITILPQAFKPVALYIEPDWSAASYWYSIAALAPEAKIFLKGLKKYSLQGDSRITELMANFGISSVFNEDGVYIEKGRQNFDGKLFDLKNCPDLAQTIIVYCAAAGINAAFTGLETLKIKETNRILALQTELKKIGVTFDEQQGVYTLDTSGLHFPDTLEISTYEDHRMAMAFAPLAIKVKKLIIHDLQVVEKSYPDFWKHLGLAGFEVSEINT